MALIDGETYTETSDGRMVSGGPAAPPPPPENGRRAALAAFGVLAVVGLLILGIQIFSPEGSSGSRPGSETLSSRMMDLVTARLGDNCITLVHISQAFPAEGPGLAAAQAELSRAEALARAQGKALESVETRLVELKSPTGVDTVFVVQAFEYCVEVQQAPAGPGLGGGLGGR